MENAFQSQLVHKGALVENLIKLGYVDEKKVLNFYSWKYDLPIIKEKFLQNIPLNIIDKLPKDLVFEWRILPVGMKDGQFVVAGQSPLGAQIMNDISFFVGKQARQVLIGTKSLFDAIRYYYTIRIPLMFVPESKDERQIPKKKEIRRADKVKKTAAPSETLMELKKRVQTAMDSSLSDFTHPKEENIQAILDAFPETKHFELPESLKESKADYSQRDDGAKETEIEVERGFPREIIDNLEERLSDVETRDDVIEISCKWLSLHFEIAAFLAVKKSQATGFFGIGGNKTPEEIKDFEVSLNLVSSCQTAAYEKRPIVSSDPEDASIKHILGFYELEAPILFMVLPVVLKEKTIGLFIGLVSKETEFEEIGDSFWRAVQDKIGSAFETLILSRKIGV